MEFKDRGKIEWFQNNYAPFIHFCAFNKYIWKAHYYSKSALLSVKHTTIKPGRIVFVARIEEMALLKLGTDCSASHLLIFLSLYRIIIYVILENIA